MKLKNWTLAVAIYVGSGQSFQSMHVGVDGIVGIELLPSGMVLIERLNGAILAIHGNNWGELTPEAADELRSKRPNGSEAKGRVAGKPLPDGSDTGKKASA